MPKLKDYGKKVSTYSLFLVHVSYWLLCIIQYQDIYRKISYNFFLPGTRKCRIISLTFSKVFVSVLFQTSKTLSCRWLYNKIISTKTGTKLSSSKCLYKLRALFLLEIIKILCPLPTVRGYSADKGVNLSRVASLERQTLKINYSFDWRIAPKDLYNDSKSLSETDLISYFY